MTRRKVDVHPVVTRGAEENRAFAAATQDRVVERRDDIGIIWPIDEHEMTSATPVA